MPERARATGHSFRPCLCALVLGLGAIGLGPAESVALGGQVPEGTVTFTPRTKVSLKAERWCLNGEVTYRGTRAEGLLMNVRMVNSVFEDRRKPDFDPEANTNRFLSHLPDYAAHGVRAFTICLQGGRPRYEGAVNSAFAPDGSLRESYLARVRRVIEACDRHGLVVILGCFYQRQDQVLKDEDAVRTAVTNAAGWIRKCGFQNVVLEIANEFGHSGFDHPLLRTDVGQVELIRLAQKAAPGLLVSTAGLGDGRYPDKVAKAADFLLIHFNDTALDDIPTRIAALKKYGKPIVCNEDDKLNDAGARAAELCVTHGASWGFMANEVNQRYPFRFEGARDDPVVYAKLKELTSPRSRPASAWDDYFPPPESQGGWRKLNDPDSIRTIAGMDPDKLTNLRAWLRDSDERGFAAVVIRHGYIVLEEERRNSSVSNTGRVASCSKAICATVLAIASEESQQGHLPRKMTFEDHAFDFIPWAWPLSDPRKATITVKQLLNHTSGICPEALGAPNDGTWDYILGHSGDARTAKLAFDPGTACGYSTHALEHAALVCETVTRQALRPVRHRGVIQTAGNRTLVVSILRRGAEVRPSSVTTHGHARARPGADRVLHGPQRPLARQASDPAMVRRADRLADPQRARAGNALQVERRELLSRLGAARAPDWRARPERSRNPGRRPIQARLRRPVDRVCAEPRPGRHAPDRQQRRVAV